MSLNSLKRDIARIKRKKGIDFEKIDYELALERHRARLDILMAEKLADLFDKFENYSAPKRASQHYSGMAGDDLRRDAEKAKEFLGDDKPEMWKKDQATIETLHPKISKVYNKLQDIPSLGSSPKEMWKHYQSILTTGLEKEEEEKRKREKEKERQRGEMEKKYGKPVRLHPDFSNNTLKYYTPEFADERKVWDLSHLFPYKDFPEHDGRSVIELCDSD